MATTPRALQPYFLEQRKMKGHNFHPYASRRLPYRRTYLWQVRLSESNRYFWGGIVGLVGKIPGNDTRGDRRENSDDI